MGDGGEKQSAGVKPIVVATPSVLDRSSSRAGPRASDAPPLWPTRSSVKLDAFLLKKKLKQAIAKPKYDVTHFYKNDGRAQAIARSQIMEYSTIVVILFNSFWIAFETDYNDADSLVDAEWYFILAEYFFCSFFTAELCIRFAAFADKMHCLQDGWFMFDGFMVVLMVFETYILVALALIFGTSSNNSANTASMLKIFKLFRLARVARIAKLVRLVPELIILLKGMIIAGKSVAVTMSLLAIVLYVFAIFFVQTSSVFAPSAHGEFFTNMKTSVNTLWLNGILVDETSGIAMKLWDENWVLLLVFYCFILLSAFMVMNLLIGILCEVIIQVSHAETEQNTIEETGEKLRAILRIHQDLLPKNVEQTATIASDTDGDLAGLQISKKAFLNLLEDKRVANLLNDICVDVFGLVDLVDAIFADEDGHAKTLSFSELLGVLLELRGTNTAKVKDITDLRRLIHVKIDATNRKIQILSTQLDCLGAMVESAVHQPGDFTRRATEARSRISNMGFSNHQSQSTAWTFITTPKVVTLGRSPSQIEPLDTKAIAVSVADAVVDGVLTPSSRSATPNSVHVSGAPEDWFVHGIQQGGQEVDKKAVACAEASKLGLAAVAATVGRSADAADDSNGVVKPKKRFVRLKVKRRSKSDSSGMDERTAGSGLASMPIGDQDSLDMLDLTRGTVELAEVRPPMAGRRIDQGSMPTMCDSSQHSDCTTPLRDTAETSWKLTPLVSNSRKSPKARE